jgi:hypothetical protein
MALGGTRVGGGRGLEYFQPLCPQFLISINQAELNSKSTAACPSLLHRAAAPFLLHGCGSTMDERALGPLALPLKLGIHLDTV